ncbi:MAG: hypothetical protein IJW00_10645 [Clostridia bacterium]|nr:hypothetical protein [Clostridia bacterium]
MNQEDKRPEEMSPQEEGNTPNRFEEEARLAKEATNRLKRIILIIAAAMVVFVVAALVLMPILDRAISGSEQKNEETTVRYNTVIYYDPDYDYDIMQDREYLELDRYIYYKDARTGETIILLDQDIPGYGEGMVTLKAMIDAIIAGDHETYNSLFSSNYFAVEGREPEPPFTMQQVYDILITHIEVTDVIDEKLGRYTQYEYTVEYKIHKNNGTFRTDLGHDDSRKQYFILSDSTGDQVLIDQILGYNYKN